MVFLVHLQHFGKNLSKCLEGTKKTKVVENMIESVVSYCQNFGFFCFFGTLTGKPKKILENLRFFETLTAFSQNPCKTLRGYQKTKFLRISQDPLSHIVKSVEAFIAMDVMEEVQKWTVFLDVLEISEWFETHIKISERFGKAPLAAYLIYIYIYIYIVSKLGARACKITSTGLQNCVQILWECKESSKHTKRSLFPGRSPHGGGHEPSKTACQTPSKPHKSVAPRHVSTDNSFSLDLSSPKDCFGD